jgi:hypothetical protein
MARRHNTVREPSRGSVRVLQINGDIAPPEAPAQDQTPEERAKAAGWQKGQLLNVRNAGSHYNVTLVGEEYDPQHPERCLQFTQPNDCQAFVSAWYSPEGGSRPPWG